MKYFFRKKLITPCFALCMMIGSIGATLAITQLLEPSLPQPSIEQLYQLSVEDAMIAEADEIAPLVSLTQTSDMVTWKETGDKVLLVSWHKYPDRYPQGETIKLTNGELWTFTDKEIANWYAANKDDVSDWDLRLKQLIGLPPSSKYTHVTAFWVDVQDVVRPAYSSDVTDDDMSTTFEDSEPNAFHDWFNGNILFSYYESAYPWTRLGYTYDWADNGTEYGLSEFLIQKDAEVMVEFTKTTDEFLEWLKTVK